MNHILKTAIVALLVSSGAAWAQDDRLSRALHLANSGQADKAVAELNALKSSSPNDYRVYQSLGLIYQGQDKIDPAINELERAVSLKGTPEAWYALGLLYEAKMVSSSGVSGWSDKARNAWKQVVSLTSPGESRRSVAERHLDRSPR